MIAVTPLGGVTLIGRDGVTLSFNRAEAVEIARALHPLLCEEISIEAEIEARLQDEPGEPWFWEGL